MDGSITSVTETHSSSEGCEAFPFKDLKGDLLKILLHLLKWFSGQRWETCTFVITGEFLTRCPVAWSAAQYTLTWTYRCYCVLHTSGGSRGGGPGGQAPPYVPRCRLFNIGPKIGPLSGPPFFAGRPNLDPPPFQKSWIRPCIHSGNSYLSAMSWVEHFIHSPCTL